jgi:hypothetical protein
VVAKRAVFAALRQPVSTDSRWQKTTVGKAERVALNGHRAMIV